MNELTQEQYKQFRDIVSSRPEDERVQFITKFSNLSDDSKKIAVQRTLEQAPKQERLARTQALSEDRPNALQGLRNTLNDTNMFAPNISMGERIKRGAGEALGFNLPRKALALQGAAGQVAEAAVATPIVAGLQEGKRGKEFIDRAKKSLSGEAPIERGDIFRNMGVPEIPSRILGLATDPQSLIKSGASKAVGLARKAMAKATGKSINKVSDAAVKAHLRIFVNNSPRGSRWAMLRKFKFIKRKQNQDSVARDLDNVETKLRTVVDNVRKKANKQIEDALIANKNNAVSAAPGELTLNTRNMLDTSGIFTYDPIARKTIKADVDGVDKLLNVMKKVETSIKKKGSISFSELRSHRATLTNIASDPKLKGVYAAANQLSDDLTFATKTVGDRKLKTALNNYTKVSSLLKGNERKGIIGVESILEESKLGNSSLRNLMRDTFPEASRTSLQAFNDILPKNRKFLDELRDAATNIEYQSFKPGKSFSLIGAGMITSNLLSNPVPGMAVSGVGVLSSPKAVGLAYKGAGEIADKVSGSKVTKTLLSISDILQSTTIDPAIVRLSRQTGLIGRPIDKAMSNISDQLQENITEEDIKSLK